VWLFLAIFITLGLFQLDQKNIFPFMFIGIFCAVSHLILSLALLIADPINGCVTELKNKNNFFFFHPADKEKKPNSYLIFFLRFFFTFSVSFIAIMAGTLSGVKKIFF
jgi:hypothetical protein